MKPRSAAKLSTAIGLCLLSCACGGGGGNGIASTPSPAPTPTPTPAIPPIPPGSIGLQSANPFATFSARLNSSGTPVAETDAVKIAYSAADGLYTVTLPGFQQGVLVPKSGYGSFNENGWINLQGTNSDLTLGAGPATQNVRVTLDWPASSEFSYTSFGHWFTSFTEVESIFAYGIPTAGANMPLTGSASYNGQIRGRTSDHYNVFGSVFLSFNFGAGQLSGNMKPEIADWDSIPLGTYTFRDTVYSTGNTTFSGAFIVPGSNAPSSFSGSFTGPQAAELMASWQAPFLYPGTTQGGTMSGVWVAKKP